MAKKKDTKNAHVRPFPELDPTLVPFPSLSDQNRADMGVAVRHHAALIAGTDLVGLVNGLLSYARTSAMMGDPMRCSVFQSAAVIINHTVRASVAGLNVVELNDRYQSAIDYGSKLGNQIIRNDGTIVDPAEVKPPQ